jgi:two-component system cell cycle response regulator CpdR
MADRDQPLDVLIVEDEPVVRSVMSDVLAQAGYAVTAVENGLAGLKEVEQHQFRAIVCDIHMPVLDGIRFYEQVVSAHPDQARRFLFITGVAHSAVVAEFFAQKAFRVLEKPYELRALVNEVAGLVGRPPAAAMIL